MCLAPRGRHNYWQQGEAGFRFRDPAFFYPAKYRRIIARPGENRGAWFKIFGMSNRVLIWSR